MVKFFFHHMIQTDTETHVHALRNYMNTNTNHNIHARNLQNLGGNPFIHHITMRGGAFKLPTEFAFCWPSLKGVSTHSKTPIKDTNFFSSQVFIASGLGMGASINFN